MSTTIKTTKTMNSKHYYLTFIFLFTASFIYAQIVLHPCKSDDFGGEAWYLDADSDGYGNPHQAICAQTQPAGYVAGQLQWDLNDNDATIYPGAIELCDGKDNDQDGSIDEDKPATPAAVSVSNQCGKSILTRGNAPSGVTWFWQSTATGTSTINTTGNSIVRTSGSTYYLRARNNSSLCWSDARMVTYSIIAVPSVPSATVSNQCGKSIITRNNPPSGVTWYWQSSSGLEPVLLTVVLSITRTSGSAYYLRARNNAYRMLEPC